MAAVPEVFAIVLEEAKMMENDGTCKTYEELLSMFFFVEWLGLTGCLGNDMKNSNITPNSFEALTPHLRNQHRCHGINQRAWQ